MEAKLKRMESLEVDRTKIRCQQLHEEKPLNQGEILLIFLLLMEQRNRVHPRSSF